MATVKDEREDKSAAFGYVVFTDKFMSGWGGAAGGRSLYALACQEAGDADRLLAAGSRRSEMKRGRWVRTLRNVKGHMGPHDHISIVNREMAGPWYEPGAFSR